MSVLWILMWICSEAVAGLEKAMMVGLKRVAVGPEKETRSLKHDSHSGFAHLKKHLKWYIEIFN